MVRGSRPGRRPHPLAGVVRRVCGAWLRDQDGGGAVRGPGDRAGVPVGRPSRSTGRAASADSRWRGDGRRRPGLAAGGDPHSGGRPAVDLGHVGQQHLVTDLQLQRPRTGHRPDRRPGGHRRWRRRGRRVWGRHRDLPAAAVRPGRSGRLADRLRDRRRPGRAGRHPAAAQRSAHGLADRDRRRIWSQRDRFQLRLGDLPSVLRQFSGAVHGGAGWRRRRTDPRWRARRPDPRAVRGRGGDRVRACGAREHRCHVLGQGRS